jgi:hypothetical protein
MFQSSDHVIREAKVGKNAALLIASFFILAGCAGTSGTVQDTGDYVEVDNPALTMSPGAPPTIWVPRSYVEHGIPRGGEVLEKGVASLKGSPAESGGQQAAPQTAAARQAPAVQPSPVQPPPVLPPVPAAKPAPAVAPVRQTPARTARHKIFVIEAGQHSLQPRFSSEMKKASAVNLVDAAQAAFVSRYASAGTVSERSTLSRKLQEDFAATLTVFLTAPEGMAPGKVLAAEVYETHGGSLVRKVEALIGDYPRPDAHARDRAIDRALRELSIQVGEVAAFVPWYGRVVAVEGDRIYLNAGKESGLGIGMALNLYRSGKIIEKLGYAPGQKAAIVEIRGFVGTDGAFAAVREGGKAQVSDLVGFE